MKPRAVKSAKWARVKSLVPEPVKKPLRRWLKTSAAPVIRGSRPKMLSVEVTNHCNLNCPFCLVGQQNSLPTVEHDLLRRGLGFMSLDLYEKILRDALDFGIGKIQLHFQGEPLLHKRFPEMVGRAKKRGFQTQVFTNGLPLTEKTARAILDAGLDHMRFSVDGASEEIYRKSRVGGTFAKAYKNMALMASLARENGSSILLEWQFIAMRNNEHEIETARTLAQEIGIPLSVKTYAATDPNLVPLDPRHRRRLHIKPCLDIYRAVLVYWNGLVVPCCYDVEGESIVGDLSKNTLEEVWNSTEYVDLRRRIDNAFHDPGNEPGICRKCLKWGHEPNRTSGGDVLWTDHGADSPPLETQDDLV